MSLLTRCRNVVAASRFILCMSGSANSSSLRATAGSKSGAAMGGGS
jgi:hypothetical protein